MTINLSLAQLFGPGASQSATALIIQKADLQTVGLTPQASNTAESLLVALVKLAAGNFRGTLTDPSGANVTAPDGEPITFDNSEIYKLDLFFWRSRLISGWIRQTYITEVFLSPPTDPGIPLTPDLLNYD